ncbi:unnamed protein product, partial [Ectocarpus sp. 13 AM-2016]
RSRRQVVDTTKPIERPPLLLARTNECMTRGRRPFVDTTNECTTGGKTSRCSTSLLSGVQGEVQGGRQRGKRRLRCHDRFVLESAQVRAIVSCWPKTAATDRSDLWGGSRVGGAQVSVRRAIISSGRQNPVAISINTRAHSTDGVNQGEEREGYSSITAACDGKKLATVSAFQVRVVTEMPACYDQGTKRRNR